MHGIPYLVLPFYVPFFSFVLRLQALRGLRGEYVFNHEGREGHEGREEGVGLIWFVLLTHVLGTFSSRCHP